jgi:hypothetical protein
MRASWMPGQVVLPVVLRPREVVLREEKIHSNSAESL